MPISTTALVSGLSRVLAAGKRGKMAGEEMQRQQTEHAEDRNREAMHSLIEQQVLQGHLADTGYVREHRASHDREIAAAAAKLRQNPRYRAIWDLPDDELVQEAGRIAVERERPSYLNAGGVQQNRRLTAVAGQVDDTARDLAAARRAVPKRPAIGFLSPEDSTQYHSDSTAAEGRVEGLQHRADSLGAVRDSLAAYLEGRSPGPINGSRTPPPAGPKRRITADQRDYLQATGNWDPNKYDVIDNYGPPQ